MSRFNKCDTKVVCLKDSLFVENKRVNKHAGIRIQTGSGKYSKECFSIDTPHFMFNKKQTIGKNDMYSDGIHLTVTVHIMNLNAVLLICL